MNCKIYPFMLALTIACSPASPEADNPSGDQQSSGAASDDASQTHATSSTDSTGGQDESWPDVTEQDLSDADVDPEIDDEQAAPTRSYRRMDLDQLRASLSLVFGGLSWQEKNQDKLLQLAPTLGYPDYVEITQEDLTYSLLFAKFLDDAARALCSQRLNLVAKAAASDRRFLLKVEPTDTDATKVKANLRALILLFHGKQLEDNTLESWYQLFSSIAATSDALAAWQGVCVALVIHPDFATY